MNGHSGSVAIVAALSGLVASWREDWRVWLAWTIFVLVILVAAMWNDAKKGDNDDH